MMLGMVSFAPSEAPDLLTVLFRFSTYRQSLSAVLVRANDGALAKRAGLIDRVVGNRGGVLSKREAEIMDHLRQGRKNAEIAASLSIATATVKRHLDHIYAKLGARTRAEAITRYAEIEMAESDAAVSE